LAKRVPLDSFSLREKVAEGRMRVNDRSRHCSLAVFLLAAFLLSFDHVAAEEAKPADASDAVIEREFRQLLELDDKVHDDVDEWIRSNAKLAAKQVGVDPASLDLQVRNRLSEVGAAYAAFLNRHSGHVRARLAYGSYFSDINEIDKAMAQWKKALELAPKNPVAWNNIGKAYGKQGRIAEAFRHFGKAGELAPKEALYYRNLATLIFSYPDDAARYYLIDRSQIVPKSLELFKKARALDPENFTLATDAALAQLGTQPFEAKAALAAWNDALAIAPSPVEAEGVRIHLARIHAHLGQVDAARALLAKVYETQFAELKAGILRKLEPPPAKP
jgi:tetratricopeptide (TPR) repeat protein